METPLIVNGLNLLVLPEVDGQIRHQTIAYHQLMIKFSSPADNLFTNTDNSLKEIDAMIDLFDQSQVVDLNCEYMPSCLILTVLDHSHVNSLLSKSKLSYHFIVYQLFIIRKDCF